MTLPPIPLSALPEQTKDYLIAYCNQHGCSPEQAIKATLDASASAAGFSPTSNQEAAVMTAVMA